MRQDIYINYYKFNSQLFAVLFLDLYIIRAHCLCTVHLFTEDIVIK